MGTFSIHRVMSTFGWEETAVRVRFRHIRMDPVLFCYRKIIAGRERPHTTLSRRLFVEKNSLNSFKFPFFLDPSTDQVNETTSHNSSLKIMKSLNKLTVRQCHNELKVKRKQFGR